MEAAVILQLKYSEPGRFIRTCRIGAWNIDANQTGLVSTFGV